MKKILTLVTIIIYSCSQQKHEPKEQMNYLVGDSSKFCGITIKEKYGDNNHFLKILGNDSLFVNIVNEKYEYSYIYFTKGNNVTSLSWDTGGKYSKKITNIKIK